MACYAAAKKEEEELKAQKSSGGQTTQQKGGEAHSASSSEAAPSSSVAGSISLASWSHQGVAEKAKEVCRLFKLESLFVREQDWSPKAYCNSLCVFLAWLQCFWYTCVC